MESDFSLSVFMGSYSQLFKYLLLCILIIFTCFAGVVSASECRLKGKAIEYYGILCTIGNCENLYQKIIFLGDKILLYRNIKKDEGDVYLINDTINLKESDRFNQVKDFGKDVTDEIVTAKSIVTRDKIILTRFRQATSKSTGITAKQWHKVELEIIECNECKVKNYYSREYGAKYRDRESKLHNSSCFIR